MYLKFGVVKWKALYLLSPQPELSTGSVYILCLCCIGRHGVARIHSVLVQQR